jgi:hypothetical protein
MIAASAMLTVSRDARFSYRVTTLCYRFNRFTPRSTKLRSR